MLTVSDTRNERDDRGGALILQTLADFGHEVLAREIVPDEPQAIKEAVRLMVANPEVGAVLVTGGTGIAPRDHTVDVVSGLITKVLPGYGELFRMLSYQEIGPAAMLSRAMCGVADGKLLLTMPGSPAAVRLAMDRLIIPELPHLVGEMKKS